MEERKAQSWAVKCSELCILAGAGLGDSQNVPGVKKKFDGQVSAFIVFKCCLGNMESSMLQPTDALRGHNSAT